MIWLVFRQNRAQLFIWLAGVVGFASFLLYAAISLEMQIATSHLGVCVDLAKERLTQPPDQCTGPEWMAFAQSFSHFDRMIFVAILVLPPVIAAFGIAPLLTVEFEHGTHLLAWTQGITRNRWLAVKVAGAAAVALATWLVVVLAAWPWMSLAVKMEPEWARFEMFAPDLLAAMVFASATAILAGAALRRSVAAMAASIAVYGACRAAFTIWFRPNLLPPMVREGSTALSGARGDEWYLGFHYVDGAGHEVSFQRVNEISAQAGSAAPAVLQGQGIHLVALFQPAGRFWTFQAIEAAVFMVAAAIFFSIAFSLIQRRVR